MEKKDKKYKLWYFHRRPDILAILVLVVIMTAVRPVLVVPGVMILVLVACLDMGYGKIGPLPYAEVFEDVAASMDEVISNSVVNNPFPLCSIDNSGRVIWSNDAFNVLFREEKEKGAINIAELTGLKIQELSNEELAERLVNVSAIGRTFRVRVSRPQIGDAEDLADMTTMCMVHWMDCTELENLKRSNRDGKMCVAAINVDNFDDIVAQAPDEKKASLAGDIEKALRQWATRVQGAIVRQSKTRFTLIVDRHNLDTSVANKFPILDEVRSISTGGDIPASLSIGVGAGGKSFAQTAEFSEAALDLALARGGDQAVVKDGTTVDYYGGKLVAVEKRNKGKSRIVAFALRQLIDQAPHVYVMGHKLPDMDSLGSALGVSRMAKNRGKEVDIVIDSHDAVEMLYNLAVEDGCSFVSSDYAKNSISRDDLLIVVDTHKPSLCECGALCDMVDKIVVIDHHRRGEEIIQNPTLIHIEPYASSASELVAEMLQYLSTEKKELRAIEAEGLLSGIAVDTKNFSIKTGVRTFEAATWLRRQGADTTVVRQFFQTDMDLFKDKAGIIARAKTLPDSMAISSAEGPKKNVSVLISMAADELLNIRGMRATFVVGESVDGGLRVSARSLGDVNVQRIMEKIGGGGNLTTAGAQLADMTVDEAVTMIEGVIVDFLKEEEEIKARNREKELAKELAREKEKEKDQGQPKSGKE